LDSGRVKEPRASAPSSSAVASERLASSGAVLEAPAFVSSLDNVAVVGQTIKQRTRHLSVYEDARPFAKSKIGRDDDGGAFIELADQMEQQLTAGLAKGR